jgi:hypothetical protein
LRSVVRFPSSSAGLWFVARRNRKCSNRYAG